MITRVDEFQKKYPDLPREIIVKWDVMNRGLKHSEGLDKLCTWLPPLGTYQSYDHDESLKELAKKTSDGSRPGFVKRPPGSFHMKNGLGVRIQRDKQSPYEIRETGPDRFALYEGDEKVEDIYFVNEKSPAGDLVTSKGTRVSSLVNAKRVCFQIAPVRYCEYFTNGEQCKFCNFNSSQEDARAIGLDRAVTIGLEETVEAYRILSSNTRFVEGRAEMGGFRNREQEVRVHANFYERIASATPQKPNLSLHTQPMDRRDMQRFKDAGVDCITYQMEVWDPELFAEICPGKAKYTGHERYKEAFLEAVDVFGVGHVAACFVGGVTLMPANGFKTWQESRDSFVEGLRWAAKNGMLPIFLNLRLGPGSVYGDDQSSQAKAPPTDYYLDSVVAAHEAMTEAGLYQKLNKLMDCPMDCLDAIHAGEVGIIELAGNVGNWLADTIPSEANWLARLISSVSAPARA